MLLEILIQRVQSLYSKGVHSQDTRLSSTHIYHVLRSVRNRLIYEELFKRRKVNQWNYQTLPCVELIDSNIHECDCILPLGCKIKRTKYKIPKPLTDANTHMIQTVLTLDGEERISEIKLGHKKYIKGNRYTTKSMSWFVKNEYIYVLNFTGNLITITGLWEDPILAANFHNYCKEKDCVNCESNCIDYLKTDFPIDSEKEEILMQMCMNELIIMFGNMKQDTTNNNQDDRQETK